MSGAPLNAVLALLAALAAGCAGAEPEREPAPRYAPPRPAPPLAPEQKVDAQPAGETGADADAAPEPTVAGWIAGEPLAYEAILEEWHRVAPREVFLVVEKLISARLGQAEAARLGIRLDPAVVDAEVEAQIARFRADVAAEEPGVAVEDFVRNALGVEPERYWRRIRDGVIRQMLVERAVRAWALESENASVRLIVVATEEEARALADELAAGADFGALAEEHSLDESGARGGLIPYLVRQEHSPLARVAFNAAPGEVVGPVPAAGHRFLVRLEEKRPAIGGGWPELAGPVEASLREHPVEESEFTHWKLSMEERYAVDLEPLLETIGAPRRRGP